MKIVVVVETEALVSVSIVVAGLVDVVVEIACKRSRTFGHEGLQWMCLLIAR